MNLYEIKKIVLFVINLNFSNTFSFILIPCDLI